MTKISADIDLFGDLASDFQTLGPDVEPVLIEWYGQNYGKAVQHVTTQGLGSVTSGEGVDGESSFAQTNPRAATWAKARAGDLIVDIAASAKEETIAKLKSVLGEAYDNPNVTRQDVTDAISELWDAYPDWKADLISRTETALAENGATAAAYKDTGVEFVLISDGTNDDACAAADGATWTVEDFEAHPIAHPNCSRAGSPLDSTEVNPDDVSEPDE
jgi:hypothetical protein